MKTMMIAAALGLTALTAAMPAAAQGVGQREANQQARIVQGARTGALTPGEARHLQHQQDKIPRKEAHMRARNGGHLNPRQRARLERKQNHADRAIFRAKHNGRIG